MPIIFSDTESEEEELLQCLNCSQTFPSQARLLSHLRQVSRSSKSLEHCFLCDYLSTNPEDLSNHLQKFHPDHDLSVIYVCQECDANFKTEEDTICHLKTCEMKQTLEELAEFVDIDEKEDAEHCYARQDQNTKNPESISRKTTEIKANIMEKPKLPEQKNEEFEFYSKKGGKKAAIPHESDVTYKIFHFFNTKDLEEIKKGYTCPDCGKTYSSYVSAKSHLKTMCNKEAEQCCKLCDYKTRLKTNLRRHIRLMHKAPDLYICDQCGKEFKQKYLFSHHIRYNCASLKPYKCHRCDFETKVPGIMNSHLFKVHNELRPKDDEPPKTDPKREFPDPIKVPGGFKCPDCQHFFHVPDTYKNHRLRRRCGKQQDMSVRCLVESCEYITNCKPNLILHMKRNHCMFARCCRKNKTVELVDQETDISDSLV